MDVRPPAFELYAVEGRNMIAVTHLALLGVKIQDPAFRGITKDGKQSSKTAAFAVSYKDTWRNLVYVVLG